MRILSLSLAACLLLAGALIVIVCRADGPAIGKSEVFRAGMIAVVAVFIKHVTLRGSGPAKADAVEGEDAPSALVGAME